MERAEGIPLFIEELARTVIAPEQSQVIGFSVDFRLDPTLSRQGAVEFDIAPGGNPIAETILSKLGAVLES